MASIIASREHGAKHDAIQGVIDSFPGMAHRLEYVRKVGGVEFFNDSKATNVHAVIRALDAFEENVILKKLCNNRKIAWHPDEDLPTNLLKKIKDN